MKKLIQRKKYTQHMYKAANVGKLIQSTLVGLKINAKKSKVMRVNAKNDQRMEINGEQVEEVEEFVYLGALLDK